MKVGLCCVESMLPSFWKSHSHDVGPPVDASVNWTVSGAVPLVGEAENDAVGAVPPPPPPSGKYWWKYTFDPDASTTRPVAGLTFCFVEVALFSSPSAFFMTGVPLPAGKAMEPIGDAFS